MNTNLFRMICRVLVASMLLMTFSSAQATMIGAEQLAASPSAAAERLALVQTVSRGEVAQQLQALGIEPQAALERVNAMTDEEVHALSGQVSSLPAGAHSNAWWIAAVVVVAVVIWYFWK